MPYLKLESMPGEHIREVAADAIEVSRRNGVPVGFDFNGVTCSVDSQDHPDNVEFFFLAACRMGWKRLSRARRVPMGILEDITAVDDRGQYRLQKPKEKYPEHAE